MKKLSELTSEEWFEILGYEIDTVNDIRDIRIEKTVADTFAKFILPKIREYYQSNEDVA